MTCQVCLQRSAKLTIDDSGPREKFNPNISAFRALRVSFKYPAVSLKIRRLALLLLWTVLVRWWSDLPCSTSCEPCCSAQQIWVHRVFRAGGHYRNSVRPGSWPCVSWLGRHGSKVVAAEIDHVIAFLHINILFRLNWFNTGVNPKPSIENLEYIHLASFQWICDKISPPLGQVIPLPPYQKWVQWYHIIGFFYPKLSLLRNS